MTGLTGGRAHLAAGSHDVIPIEQGFGRKLSARNENCRPMADGPTLRANTAQSLELAKLKFKSENQAVFFKIHDNVYVCVVALNCRLTFCTPSCFFLCECLQ